MLTKITKLAVFITSGIVAGALATFLLRREGVDPWVSVMAAGAAGGLSGLIWGLVFAGMDKSKLCSFCRKRRVRLIPPDEPWTTWHWACPRCNSTYPLDAYPKKKGQK